jgi:hypothetical protein
MDQKIVDYAEEIGKKWNLPPGTLTAVMRQESGGNPNARSKAGAIGLMQFMPGTAKSYGINPYDPYDSIRGAGMYLGRNYKTYGGNLAKTLASYNAGAGAVAKYNGVPPYAETQNYVKTIMGSMGQPWSGGFSQTPQGGSNMAVPTVIKKVGLNDLVKGSAKAETFIPGLKVPVQSTELFDPVQIKNQYYKRLNQNATQLNNIPTNGVTTKLGKILGVGGQYDPKVQASYTDRLLNNQGREISDFNTARDYLSANKHVVRNSALKGAGAGAGIGTLLLPGIGTVLGGALGAGFGAVKGSRELNALASKAVKGANTAENLVNQELQNVRVQADTAKRINEANQRAGGADESYNLRSAFNEVGNSADSKGVMPLIQNALTQGNQGRNNQIALIGDKVASLSDSIVQARKLGDQGLVKDLEKQRGIFTTQLSLLQGSNEGAIAQGRGEGLGGLNQLLNTSLDINKMSNQSALAQALANTESKTQLGVANIGKDAQLGVANIGKDAQLGVAGIGLEGQRLGYEAQKEMAQLPFNLGKELIAETNTRTRAVRDAIENKSIRQLMALDPTLTEEQAYKGIMQYHMRKVPVLGGLFGMGTDLILPGSSANLEKAQSNMSPYQSNATLFQLLGGGGSK